MTTLSEKDMERLKHLLIDDMNKIDERLANMLVDIAMSAKGIAADINEIRTEIMSILEID